MIAIRKSFLALLLGFTLVTGVLGFTPPAKAITIASEYTEITQLGLIFANICPSARPDSGADPCPCRGQGLCTVDNILQVIVNVSYLILALSGSAALIALVYGGLEWVISAGNPERVKRGKDALSGAVIGLAIVFGAYVFINLLISVLNSGNIPTSNLETTIGNGANQTITTDTSTP
ncbi:TPA: hypothetical protein DEP96_01190 [Candidatus Uhrbacteria bacterium]|nr:hypothetical protein [Candidatus Uhrbacteria bacterium]